MNMAKRPVPKYDFKAFGAAIKAARTGRKESRKKVCDEMFISPRYLANIENNGQHPSLQIFFELRQGRYRGSAPRKTAMCCAALCPLGTRRAPGRNKSRTGGKTRGFSCPPRRVLQPLPVKSVCLCQNHLDKMRCSAA